MLAARNRVKLPGGCVNGLCQVHYRSRLDTIDLETAMHSIEKWESLISKQTMLFQKDTECRESSWEMCGGSCSCGVHPVGGGQGVSLKKH